MFRNESYLYHLWDGILFSTIGRTISGKNIQIIHVGERNNFEGPDFLNAIIKINDEILKGDIEIHIKTSDWVKHKHFADENFSNTILHVVYNHDSNEDLTEIKFQKYCEIFELADITLDLSNSEAVNLLKKKYIPKESYCPLFSKISVGDTKQILEDFGWLRINKKISKIKGELLVNNFNEVIYSKLLESLGYSRNKIQFIKLARIISFTKICHLSIGNAEDVSALFIGIGDLWEHLPLDFPLAVKQKWQSRYSDFNITKIEKINWNFHKVRPQNNPAIRIIQISDLIYNSLDNGIINFLLPLFSKPVGKINIKDLRNRFLNILNSNEFISDEYKLGRKRADIILFNVVLMVLLVYSEQLGLKNFSHELKKIILTFPKLIENHKEKLMKQKMTKSQIDISVNKAIHQQGLLFLYNHGCKEHQCINCISSTLSRFKEEINSYL